MMSERTFREELQQLLAQPKPTQPSANESGSEPVSERNLRRMMQATYGLAEESLSPQTADTLLTALLRAPDGNGAMLPYAPTSPNGHPTLWRRLMPSAVSSRAASAPAAALPKPSRTTPRVSLRLALLLLVLALLACVASAMWVNGWGRGGCHSSDSPLGGVPGSKGVTAMPDTPPDPQSDLRNLKGSQTSTPSPQPNTAKPDLTPKPGSDFSPAQ